jgi:hypothetical protein
MRKPLILCLDDTQVGWKARRCCLRKMDIGFSPQRIAQMPYKRSYRIQLTWCSSNYHMPDMQETWWRPA